MTEEQLSLWREWKNHLVTQELVVAFKERVEEYTEYLQEHAGKDPEHDRFCVGYISAAHDFIKAKPEAE